MDALSLAPYLFQPWHHLPWTLTSYWRASPSQPLSHNTSRTGSPIPGAQPPPAKTQKHQGDEHQKSNRRSKPKVGDFGDEKSMVILACHYFHTSISTEGAFPSDFEGNTWACEAWKLASKEYETNYSDNVASRRVISHPSIVRMCSCISFADT